MYGHSLGRQLLKLLKAEELLAKTLCADADEEQFFALRVDVSDASHDAHLCWNYIFSYRELLETTSNSQNLEIRSVSGHKHGRILEQHNEVIVS